MSIRTNPMKAVSTLLKLLVTVDKQAKLKDLKSELTNIKDLFSKVKKNEQDLLDKLTKVDGYLRNNNIPKLMEDEERICEEIKESTKKLLPADQIPQPEKANKEATASHPSTQQPEELGVIEKNYESLGDTEMKCLKSLLHFPENSVMKRRNIILWWVGVGLIEMEAAKENGEYVFGKLMDHKLIVPDKYDCVNKLFKVNPLVYDIHESRKKANDEKKPFQTYSEIVTSSHSPACLALNKLKVELSDAFGSKSNHFRGIFNTGASYLIFGSQRMAKMKQLQVLQLGRWLHASPKHHIEVNSEEFLKELRDQEKLKYLSLRGISRISQLPDSIFQLKSLETLDLKACHNLETLPGDIALLINLKHLNLSQCYLLDRMPKGIDRLKKLEVLKGFVIGSSDKTPCKIRDLGNLSKLKQLSIHIGSGAIVGDIGPELGYLLELEKLKISWGVFHTRYSKIEVKLPQKLKKLHLEGFPGQHIPEWLKPDKITTSLCELYITGGKLQGMDLQGYAHVSCSLQIIRLKYLQHLNIN
ncbi:hypothetical protein V8G54_032031 [Vigna mungo]|uniref:Disease resistance R13L4/SHOC-2-like LRR domain-containing protein n=1 Tax=Vigna mungo TaxID=3915 RepID=A0AAQ3RF02_VIGMU